MVIHKTWSDDEGRCVICDITVNDRRLVLCNIYAPHCRQATYYSYFDEDSNGFDAHDLAYSDVEKAFDKAWFNGILHLLKERGLGNEYTSYLKELNKNYQVNIKTPHVITDIVSCEDVLKQGSVLSPIEFGITTDEIAIILGKKNIGINIGDTKLPCTLWVDDILCANISDEGAQKYLDIIGKIAYEYKNATLTAPCKAP